MSWMSLTGNLETMPLPDILQFLGLGRKTGVLSVDGPAGRKQLVVEEGQAVFCSTSGPKEYLGAHLLARTRLTEADLERAFRLQRETGSRLGQILVDEGLLSEAEVAMVLHQKIADSIYELFWWTSGRFEFEERPLQSADVPVRVSLGWQDLVMEGARRSDEMARLREAIPDDHARLLARPAGYPPGFPRTTGDRKLLDCVQQNMTVTEICARFHASDFDILTRLAALVSERILEVDQDSVEEARPLGREEMLRCGTQLMERGHLVEALEVFRDANKRFFDDPAMTEGLRTCESRLRRHFVHATGDLAAVPSLKVSLEDLARAPLSAKQGFVASRVNGSWSVRSIAQICPFDELEVLCILDSLARQGIVDMRVPVGAT